VISWELSDQTGKRTRPNSPVRSGTFTWVGAWDVPFLSCSLMTSRPPFPPFDEATAAQKVQSAEDSWNTRDPERVALAYIEDSVWRNRDRYIIRRTQIIEFLQQKWQRELDYALRKELWSFHDNRITVRFQYESHDPEGQWWRSYGNE